MTSSVSTLRPLTPRGVALGAWSCGLAAAVLAVAVAVVKRRHRANLDGLFNDFYDYWAAARILGRGGNPYDPHAVGHVLVAAGVHSTVGGAYSYPILLAELARPLALLPPGPAAVLFTAGSLAALGLAVALLLSPLHRASDLELLGLATAVALFAPVTGTLYFGQVNLYVLPLLALGLRGIGPVASIAAVTAVKLYPGATMLAFLRLGRRGLRPLLLTAGAAAALAVVPNLVAGVWPRAGSAEAMFGPDPFWSNESINGWLSRLPAHGLPVTALMLAICAALGALTVALVVARRGRGWAGAFALLVCYGAVAAPKNSLWNFTPLLVAAVHWWSESSRRAAAVAALALAWALVSLQGAADALHGLRAGETHSGIALAGGLLLFAMVAWQLWTAGTVETAARGGRSGMAA